MNTNPIPPFALPARSLKAPTVHLLLTWQASTTETFGVEEEAETFETSGIQNSDGFSGFSHYGIND